LSKYLRAPPHVFWIVGTYEPTKLIFESGPEIFAKFDNVRCFGDRTTNIVYRPISREDLGSCRPHKPKGMGGLEDDIIELFDR